MPIRALIFDVDGTLAETEEAHRAAFNRAFSERELPYSWSEERYRGLLEQTGGRQRLLRFLLETGLAYDGAATLAADLHAAKNRHYGLIIGAGGVHLRPGVLECLDRARALGWRLAIATTTGRENLLALFRGLVTPIADRFECVVTGTDVSALKPDPEVYVKALAQLGVDAAEAVAVEDSVNGLVAARRAGLRCVVSPSLYTRHQNFEGAALVVPQLDQWRMEEGDRSLIGG